ncbi:hypothetical protein [Rheinheimera sp. WS51]|uniref:hypothetical protein n=1 Tax=Rheinheimera sp. WS51 TaxID=3425886 RepID=UPI003D940A88
MLDSQYDGVILEDKWGKTYLCSNCLFAYADLGPSLISDVKDKIYGRAFLHDLEPAIEQRKIWAKMYQQAHPYQLNLSGLSDFELRDRLIDIFNNNEMWIWQLSDGWGQEPDNNGIGDGGLAPDSGSGTKPPPAAKAAKPQGGGVAAENEAQAKVDKHEASSKLENEISRAELEENIITSVGENFKNSPLRQEYEKEVADLSRYADKIKSVTDLKSLEQLAIEANNARRQLGIKL